jgi:hypothetical protein
MHNNADNILFRCSGLHFIMAPKGIGKGVETNLIDIFVSAKYGRREKIESKYLKKGHAREEDAITLLSRVTKKYLKKNDQRLSNDYVTGELDVFLGEHIRAAEETFDTKCSWSAHTFFRSKYKPLDPAYKWQGHGYMWLSGAKQHTVAHCLVNGTAQAISDEKRELAWRMGIIDPELSDDREKYLEKCRQIEINHIFDIEAFRKENPFFQFDNDVKNWQWDIPMEDRLHMFVVKRDEALIKEIKDRVIESRAWMNLNLFNKAA